MDELAQMMATSLRERALRCREMASQAMSAGTARELSMIAKDYEDDADKLEDLR